MSTLSRNGIVVCFAFSHVPLARGAGERDIVEGKEEEEEVIIEAREEEEELWNPCKLY